MLGSVSAGCALLGWLTLVVVARLGSPAMYAGFAVIWAVYYALAGVLAGLQQEVTRSVLVAERTPASQGRPWFVTYVIIVVAFGACLAATFPWWGRAVDAPWTVAVPVSLGAVSLTALVMVLGLLAARGQWMSMVVVLGLDAAGRLVAVVAAALMTDSLFWYAVAVVGGGAVWVPLVWTRGFAPVRHSLGRPGATRLSLSRSAGAMTTTGGAAVLVAGLPWLSR